MSTDIAPKDVSVRARQCELIETARQEALDWKRLAAELTAGGPPAPTDTFPGYQILRQVHRGGQGIVYEAIQLATHRTVALKVIREGPLASDRSKWRFEREVKLVAALKHPNIVVVHDSGIVERNYYFAMDFVRGQPLDMYVCLSDLSTHEVVRLFEKVCDAVGHAHRRGVIHRDLKPSNILVGEDGTPYVVDFGLAKVIGDEFMESQTAFVSLAGNLIGTLPYMSPEQTRGDPEAIDTRTDVYALGVIVYELLTHSPPYRTAGIDIRKALENIENADAPPPSRLRPELGSEIDAIVLKAMAKEPPRRYQSAGEFGEDLKAWLEGRPVTAKSDSAFYVLRKLATRHYFHTSVITALLAAIVGFGGITFHALHREREAANDLQSTNARFAALNRDLTESLALSEAARNQHALGWFILEWEAGRLDAARSIQRLMPPESPEYAATAFLLDDAHTLEQLQAQVPENAAPLVLFVTGERHLKAGRTEQAAEAFKRYTDLYHGVWAPLAEARLRQLESEAVGGQPQASTEPR